MNKEISNMMKKELAQMIYRYDFDSSAGYFKYKTGEEGKPKEVILNKLGVYNDAEIKSIHSEYSRKLRINKQKQYRDRILKNLFGN